MLAGFCVLAVLYAPSISTHIAHSRDRHFVNDDARQQIWPFLRYRDAGAFENDYLADYQLALNPVGFDALYRVTAPWIDPRTLSKVVPYALLALFLAAVGVVSWRLAGPAAAWGSVLLCLSSDAYLKELGGALPRAFGFPLVALAAWALVARRPVWLAVFTCIGAATYFPLAVLIGVMLVADRAFSARASSHLERLRSLGLVAATALLSFVVMWPSLEAMRPYGPRLGPADWASFPEAAPGGRLTGGDEVRRQSPVEAANAVRTWMEAGVISWDVPWSASVRSIGSRHSGVVFGLAALVAMGGLVRAWTRNGAVARFLLVPGAALATYAAAWIAMPLLYVPERYLKFALPLAAVVFIPAGAYWLVAGRAPSRRRGLVASGAAVLVSGALVLFAGSRGPTKSGLSVEATPGQMALYDFLATLPQDSLIAGWPPVMDNVPYMSGRRVLLSQELHLPFHAAYVLEARRRMMALIDAYFATDAAPLIRLRDEYHVTHLVVDRTHFAAQPPKYFEPFGAKVLDRVGHGSPFMAHLLRTPSVHVFESGQAAVIDLGRIR